MWPEGRKLRNIRIISASAGTGKTTKLVALLDEKIGNKVVRPEAILAMTFTKQAAAELQNRARSNLLKNGRAREAHALLTARIGTVNSVCGALVSDFSFELGLSPQLRVLDETAAELELKRALASVVTHEESEELDAVKGRFDTQFDWQYEVQRLIVAARANGIASDKLAACRDRSVQSLDACLGPVVADGGPLDAAMLNVIDVALENIQANVKDTTKSTQTYVDFLKHCRRGLKSQRLRWGDWAKLGKDEPAKKSLAFVQPVHEAAAHHIEHPRMRAQMHALISMMFQIAERAMVAYQERKEARGLMDYVDQEVLALRLLNRSEIQAALEDQIDLVLVDEFQDTSPLQLAIFLKLAEVAKESVWVGDPKQAIFGFRGTDPALMDAAIQSLSSNTHDIELVNMAVETVRAPVETLSRSFRSRPELVDVTNDVFAWAFHKQQGMVDECVRIEAGRSPQPELGPVLAYWALEGCNIADRADALAGGVRELLASSPNVWDRELKMIRPARASDVAILCRTNDQCSKVADALGTQGYTAVVARSGLLDTMEAQVAMAGLRLWVDGNDSLAAATLLRLIEHPADMNGFVEKVVAEDGRERLRNCEAVQAVARAREHDADVDVLGTLDAVVEALALQRLCSEWGNATQRTANLDALRAHAGAYSSECASARDSASVVGFLGYMDELLGDEMWGQQRADAQARVGGDNAVTLSTWHAAKGLEWPIVVLFGLESSRNPSAYGVHVMSDRDAFDVDDPLGGRWLHFWPNPYTTGGSTGAVKTAYETSDAYQRIAYRASREALRVLYVGWTRAMDRLIFSAQTNKMLAGIAGTLTDIDRDLIKEPDASKPGMVNVTWAGRTVEIECASCISVDVTPSPIEPGVLRVGRPLADYAVARISPSSASARKCTLGDPVRIGEPISVRNTADQDLLGQAVHDFLAADARDAGPEARLAMAAGLLQRYGVAGVLDPGGMLAMGDRLWAWMDGVLTEGKLRREWPMGYRTREGTVISGTVDLMVEGVSDVALVDHKSYRGMDGLRKQLEKLGAQLGCYADAIRMLNAAATVTTWVHLPFAGLMVPVLF